MTSTYILSSARDACNSFVGGAQTVFTHLTNIKDDATAQSHFWKIIPSAITALTAGNSSLLHTPAGRAVTVLEGLQVIGDISDLMSGKLSKSSWKEIAGRVCFAFSNLGTTILWGAELGAVSLSAGMLKTFTFMANGGALAGFGLGAASAIYNLATAKNHKFTHEVTVKAVLDLIACTAGAALPVISLLGATLAPVTIALLVITSSGFGIASFCYAKAHEEAFEESKIKDVKEGSGLWKYCADFVNQTEGLDKFAKLFTTLAEGAENTVVTALSYDFKCFAEFNAVLNLPKRIKEWIVPNKGKYVWQENRWKIGHKVFLTALSVVGVAAFAIKYKLAELSLIAGATIGGVSVLALAAPFCVASFSACGFVDNAVSLKVEYDNNVKLNLDGKVNLKTSERRLEKWIDLSDHLKEAANQKTIEDSRSKRATKLEKESLKLDLAGKKQESNEMLDKAKEIKLLDLKEFAARKIRRLKVRHDNACLRCNKFAINLLNDFGKAAGTSLVCASMLTGAAGAAAVAVPLGAAAATFGLAAAFVAVFKFGWDNTHKEKPEPLVFA